MSLFVAACIVRVLMEFVQDQNAFANPDEKKGEDKAHHERASTVEPVGGYKKEAIGVDGQNPEQHYQ